MKRFIAILAIGICTFLSYSGQACEPTAPDKDVGIHYTISNDINCDYTFTITTINQFEAFSGQEVPTYGIYSENVYAYIPTERICGRGGAENSNVNYNFYLNCHATVNLPIITEPAISYGRPLNKGVDGLICWNEGVK